MIEIGSYLVHAPTRVHFPIPEGYCISGPYDSDLGIAGKPREWQCTFQHDKNLPPEVFVSFMASRLPGNVEIMANGGAAALYAYLAALEAKYASCGDYYKKKKFAGDCLIGASMEGAHLIADAKRGDEKFEEAVWMWYVSGSLQSPNSAFFMQIQVHWMMRGDRPHEVLTKLHEYIKRG